MQQTISDEDVSFLEASLENWSGPAGRIAAGRRLDFPIDRRNYPPDQGQRRDGCRRHKAGPDFAPTFRPVVSGQVQVSESPVRKCRCQGSSSCRAAGRKLNFFAALAGDKPGEDGVGMDENTMEDNVDAARGTCVDSVCLSMSPWPAAVACKFQHEQPSSNAGNPKLIPSDLRTCVRTNIFLQST